MKNFVFIFLLMLVVAVNCADFYLGNSTGLTLIDSEQAEYYGIPFKKRVKYVSYNKPNSRLIRAIVAKDDAHSDASVIVSAGGLGNTYVTLRLKSERGKGLYYNIGIYA